MRKTWFLNETKGLCKDGYICFHRQYHISFLLYCPDNTFHAYKNYLKPV